jgi:hypothetical protein
MVILLCSYGHPIMLQGKLSSALLNSFVARWQLWSSYCAARKLASTAAVLLLLSLGQWINPDAAGGTTQEWAWRREVSHLPCLRVCQDLLRPACPERVLFPALLGRLTSLLVSPSCPFPPCCLRRSWHRGEKLHTLPLSGLKTCFGKVQLV